jgi:hypothetical protein
VDGIVYDCAFENEKINIWKLNKCLYAERQKEDD